MWLWTSVAPSMVLPGMPSRSKWMGRKYSPTICSRGLGQQDMDVGHPAGNGVFNRNHGQVGVAAGHQFESVLEAGAGDAFQLGEHLHARNIGVGAGFTLVRNLLGHAPYGFTPGARSPK